MIEFDAATHTYTTPSGHRVPSVTQILGILNDFSKVNWQQLEYKRQLGTTVHEAAELLIQDNLDWGSVDDDAWNYLLGLQKFLEESGAVITSTEQHVFHDQYKYAGTLDAIAHWRNGLCLIDWKTSLVLPNSVGAQIAAYSEALRRSGHEHIKRHYCVRLFGDATYKVDRVDGGAQWTLFLSCLNVWKHINGNY